MYILHYYILVQITLYQYYGAELFITCLGYFKIPLLTFVAMRCKSVRQCN